MRRAALLALILVCGLLLGAYLALPWLVAYFAQSAAGASGFSEAVVRMERPGVRSALVREVRLTSPEITLTATNATLEYTLRGLFQGRLVSVQVEELALVLREAEDAEATSDGAELSPELLFPVLPVEAIQVQRLHLEVPALAFVGEGTARWSADQLSLTLNGIAPAEASRFGFAATLSKNGAFNALFNESQSDGADLLRAAGRLEDDRLALSGRFNLRGYALTLVSALAGLPEGQGAVAGDFEATVPWPLAPDLTWQAVNAKLEQATLDWSTAADDLVLDLAIASLHASGGEIDVVLGGTASAGWEDGHGRLELPAAYALGYRDGVVRGAGGPKLEGKTGDVNLSAGIQAFSLQPDAAVPVGFEADVVLSTDDLRMAGRLSGQVSPARGDLSYAGEVRMMDVAQTGSATANYQIETETAKVAGKVTFGQVRGAAFNVTYGLESGAGSLEATHRFSFRKPLAASILPDWEEVYDLDSGTVDAKVSASWRTPEKVVSRVNLRLDRVAAHYEDYLAAEIAGTLELTTEHLGEADWQLAPTTLTVGTVDVGFPIEKLRMDLSAVGTELQIADARASILGGRGRAAPFDYDMSTGNARIELTLEEIDLAAVLALEGDDVSGSGQLNGFFPLTVRNHEPSMEGGTVRSIPPGGTIRLAPALALGTGQPGLDFALVALQDFRFSELVTTVDYAENGDMRLAVQLKGNNPAVEKGRTIQYNLNITENLPILLESLRLQDEVRDRVERKLNR